MGQIFNALSSGLGKFVYGWLVPSAVAISLIWLVMVPDLANEFPDVRQLVNQLPSDATTGLLALSLATVGLSAALSLTISIRVFRILEGYSLPPVIRTWLTARQLRQFDFWSAVSEREDLPPALQAQAFEELQNFPLDRTIVMPTTLGNRLRAGETYAEAAYGLRILDLWFELVPAMDPETRRLVEDNRAGLDFHVSAIANLAILTVAGLATSLLADSTPSLVVAFSAIVLAIGTYFGAASQATEYAMTLRASASTSRYQLAHRLGYDLPDSIQEEREFWLDAGFLHAHDPTNMSHLDKWRIPSSRARK